MQPERIGRYEILETLGRGGQATVYRAYDPVMQREVAIKVLPSTLADDAQARERFEREAHTIAALEHPAIVPVYDFGEHDGGLFIVMRLMKGGTLADRLKHGAMNPEKILRILKNVASALDAAHQRGIIHRDIKPANILFDEYGTAYLSDFGIARLNSAATSLTGSLIVGTPSYMSPEQINGEQLDGRSDVYALGALLFHALTGHTPYEGETPAQALIKHLQEPVPQLKNYRPDLPSVYQDIIDRAMAKDREARYPTAGALVADLEAAVSGRPLADAATWQAMAPPTLLRRRPAGTATAEPPSSRGWLWALGALLLMALGGVAWFVGKPLLAPKPTATLPPTLTPSPEATWVPVVVPTATEMALPTATITPTTPPSPTPEPTATATVAPSPTPALGGMTVGGADLAAFTAGGDIWFLTFDGSLKQITHDGGHKRGLQWLSRDELLYLNGRCVFTVSLANLKSQALLCFNNVTTLDAFRVSPDGQQVAIVLDNELFLTPFDLKTLAEYRDPDLLPQMPNFCARFVQDTMHEILWSQDGSRIAARVTVPIGGGRAGDQIEILNPVCGQGIYRQHIFPGRRFPMATYDQRPQISSFDWDGDKQFLFTLYWRNGGFGDMYLYTRATYKGEQIQPLGKRTCCYGVPRWSPDGTHIFFAYQDINDPEGKISFYYVPAGTIDAGIPYEPLVLTENPFKGPREQLEVALRPSP